MDKRSDKLPEQIQEMVLWLKEQKGRCFRITESISCSEENYDRHVTTKVQMNLCISDVVCRFSGARIMCLGMEEELYEIGWDYLYRIEKDKNQICVFEQLPGGWTRKSEFTI